MLGAATSPGASRGESVIRRAASASDLVRPVWLPYTRAMWCRVGFPKEISLMRIPNATAMVVGLLVVGCAESSSTQSRSTARTSLGAGMASDPGKSSARQTLARTRSRSVEIRIRVDRQRVTQHGLQLSAVQRAIADAMQGVASLSWTPKPTHLLVLLRGQGGHLPDLQRLTRILVPAPGGRKIPLRSLASFERIPAPR